MSSLQINSIFIYYTQKFDCEVHKTSLKCQLCEIEMYASSERCINNISVDVWFGQY